MATLHAQIAERRAELKRWEEQLAASNPKLARNLGGLSAKLEANATHSIVGGRMEGVASAGATRASSRASSRAATPVAQEELAASDAAAIAAASATAERAGQAAAECEASLTKRVEQLAAQTMQIQLSQLQQQQGQAQLRQTQVGS